MLTRTLRFLAVLTLLLFPPIMCVQAATMNYIGNWSAKATYPLGNVVTYNNAPTKPAIPPTKGLSSPSRSPPQSGYASDCGVPTGRSPARSPAPVGPGGWALSGPSR